MQLTPTDPQHDFSIRPLDGLDDLLECRKAKASVLKVLRHPGVPPKLFLTGPPGSGKTSLIRAGVQFIACQRPQGLKPCGVCPGCVAFRSTNYGRMTGLHSDFAYWDAGRPLDYLVINCRNASVAEIEDHLQGIRHRTHALRVIHLEEAASLYRDRRDERLTEFMDDHDFNTCRWLATGVTDQELDEQFRRRWGLMVTTTPPSIDDLADRLALQCRELGIEVDSPDTWTFLAEASWCVVGRAMSVISTALMEVPPRLTRGLVEDHPFPLTDPWKMEFFRR